ncbi:MAG: autotransporter-associated beta strand repeat-containing protein [Patescibacteria group bacterium]|nr:autotransporter-associated beta strand repeat-containing protein [Patescibacteria group bacterium]
MRRWSNLAGALGPSVRFVALGFFLVGMLPLLAKAAEKIWSGTDLTSPTDFEVDNNWTGGAPADNLTDDWAILGTKGSLPNPALTGDREIYGLEFRGSGWVVGGTDHTLTVGAGGIGIDPNLANSSFTIQAKVALGGSSTWSLGTSWRSHVLTLSGGLSSQAGQTLTLANPAWYNPIVFVTGPANLAGAVVIQGPNLKIANYSPSSITGNLLFDGGVLMVDSNLARDLGAGAGQIRFASGRIGGFTNYGDSRITVTIGDGAGGAAPLQWNSTLFNPSALVLSGIGAGTGGLTLTNAIDLNGGYRLLYNYGGTNYTAELTGLISNSSATAAGFNMHNNSTGTTYLSNNANTFNGPIAIHGGTLRFETIGNLGSGPTALGNPTTTSNGLITLGGLSGTNVYTGTLLYTGSGVLSTDRDVRLAGHAAIRSTGTGAIAFTSNMQPALNDTARTFTLGGTSTGDNTFAGTIVDRSTAYPTSVVKADAGTWILSGANTYTGNTTLNAGILRASGTNSGTLGTGASQLILNGGTLQTFANTTSTVNFGRNTIINGSTTIALGRLTSGGDTSAKRQFGTLSIGNTTLTARLDAANYTANDVAGHLTFGDTTLTGNATFDLTYLRKGVNSEPRLNLGSLTDSGAGRGFTATGAWWYSAVVANGGVNVGGNVVLNGATLAAMGDWSTQNIGGNLNIAGGTLQLSGSFTRPLGTGAGQVQLTSGYAGFSTYVDGSDVTVNLTNPSTGQTANLVWGSDYFKPSALLLALGTGSTTRQLELVNPIDLNGATRSLFVYAGTGKLSGVISNSKTTPAGIIKETYDGGTLWLANDANTFDGPVQVRYSTLRFDTIADVNGGASALGAPTTAANGLISLGITTRSATLRYTGSGHSSTDRMISLVGTTGGGTITADGTGTIRFTNTDAMAAPGAGVKTLTLNGTNTGDNLFAIGILDNSSTNTTSVVKSGTGTWILGGNNTYTGTTTVSAGTLRVDGSIHAGGVVTVSGGATLGGSGTIGGLAAGAGLVSPGASAGILSVATINPSTGMDFAFEFGQTGSPDYANAAASINDVLRLTGDDPATAALGANNTVDIYFSVSDLELGDLFRGGVYVDQAVDATDRAMFLGMVQGANYNCYVLGDGGGTHSFGGLDYYTMAQYDSFLQMELSVVAEPADFGSGAIAGSVLQFRIVPEPALPMLILFALPALLLRRRRSTGMPRPDGG